MKRQKRLTKRERKANDPGFRPGPRTQNQHIHCVACGRHIEPNEFGATPASAIWITCDHGSRFASCMGCMHESQSRIDEHDRSGQAVATAAAWH
jgi:hypothetical protein